MDEQHNRRWRTPWILVGELGAMAITAVSMVGESASFEEFIGAMIVPAIAGATAGLAIESYLDSGRWPAGSLRALPGSPWPLWVSQSIGSRRRRMGSVRVYRITLAIASALAVVALATGENDIWLFFVPFLIGALAQRAAIQWVDQRELWD
jgi:hypothetical protein